MNHGRFKFKSHEQKSFSGTTKIVLVEVSSIKSTLRKLSGIIKQSLFIFYRSFECIEVSFRVRWRVTVVN